MFAPQAWCCLSIHLVHCLYFIVFLLFITFLLSNYLFLHHSMRKPVLDDSIAGTSSAFEATGHPWSRCSWVRKTLVFKRKKSTKPARYGDENCMIYIDL